MLKTSVARLCVLFVVAVLLVLPVKAQQEGVDSVEFRQDIDAVVVTGTGTEHKQADAPVQTEVIHREEIERFGSASLTHILSGLLPSFDFSRSDMGIAMQMGGLGGAYILVLVDGKRLVSNFGGQPDLDLVNPSRIDRIEIVKGAASALYGSDAIAGVINIITKRAHTDFSVSNTTRVGSYLDALQANALQFTVGPFTSLTDFILKHCNGWQNTTYEDPNRYERPVTNSINKTSNEYTDWKVAQLLEWRRRGYTINAGGSYYRKDIHRPTGVPDYKTFDFRYRNATADLGVRVPIGGGHQLTADFCYSMHAYYYIYTAETWTRHYDRTGKEMMFPYFPGDYSLESNAQRAVGHAKGVFSFPYSNQLSVGFDAEYHWLIAPQRLERESQGDFTGAFYAQNEWLPLKNFNVTAGFRLTGHRAFKLRFTPKVSVLWRLNDFCLRAAYSEGFKTPSIKELHYRYVRQMALVVLVVGNPNLKPQSSRYVSASVEYAIPRFEINVTGYANFLDNMITLVTVPRSEAPGDLLVTYAPSRVRMYKNMDKARTYGCDVNIRWRVVDKLTLRGSYSFLHTEASLYDDETSTMRSVVIDGTAHHRGTAVLEWYRDFFADRYRLSFSFSGRAQSTRFYQDDGNGKPYQLWRVNTQHGFNLPKGWKLSLSLGVDNIFNYFETTYHGLHYGTYTPGRTYYGALSLQFGKDHRPPRTASVGQDEERIDE